MLAEVKAKDYHDWAGLYTLSKHAAAGTFAPAAVKTRAGKAIGIVESLAMAHIHALQVKPGATFEKKPWPAHLTMFLRAFTDVPFRDEVAKLWEESTLPAQRAAVTEPLKAYFAAAGQAGKEAEAFEKGVAVLTGCYLTYLNADGALSANLAAWAKDAKKLKLAKQPLTDYAAALDSVKQGWQAFTAINNKANKP